MAQLLLAAAFAAEWGPWGWLAGSVLGQILFGEHPVQEGPRLNDLKVQDSTYGRMLPIAFGTVRIAGNIIDSSDLREHRSEQEYGNSMAGGTAVSYTYSADFAVELCEGVCGSITRIWADGTLVYDVRTGVTTTVTLEQSMKAIGQYMKFYPGDETQTPDPTLEALHGAGNVPAYRGTCYAVFTDLPLGNYGNRLPNLEFEVTRSTTATYLTQLATPTTLTGIGNYAAYSFQYDSIIQMGFGTPYSVNSDTDAVNITYTQSYFSGTYIGTTKQWIQTAAYSRLKSWTSGPVYNFCTVGNWVPGQFAWQKQQEGAYVVTSWAQDGGKYPITNAYGEGDYWSLWGSSYHATQDFASDDKRSVYVIQQGQTHGAWISKFAMEVNDATGEYHMSRAPHLTTKISEMLFNGMAVMSDNGFNVPIFDQIMGRIYLYNGLKLAWLDSDTFQIKQLWDFSLYSIGGEIGGQIYDGYFLMQDGHGVNKPLLVFALSDDGTYTQVLNAGGLVTDGIIYPMSNGTALVFSTGTYQLLQITPTNSTTDAVLSDVVSYLCQRAGLSVGQIDVSALTDTVHGYVVSNVSAARNCIEQLQQVYFFDKVEVDGVLKFVKRGGASQETTQLTGLIQDGSNEPISIVRTKETDLPQVVTVKYYNKANDYLVGSQLAQRMVTSTQQQVEINLPIVLTDAEAASVADKTLYWMWATRTTYQFSLPASHLARAACDVITLQTNTGPVDLMLTKIGLDGLSMPCEAIEVDSGVLTPNTSAQAVTTTQTVKPSLFPTNWEIMDIVALRDQDGDEVVYYAAGDRGSLSFLTFVGAQVYRSPDGGSTWNPVGAMTQEAVMGTCLNALPSGRWDIVDECNYLQVVLDSGSLSSCTNAQMLAGVNAALIGNEVIGFRDQSFSNNVWTLRGLLRGQRGSEVFMGTHVVGERFVLLRADGSITGVRGAFTDLNNVQKYSAVTFGDTLANGTVKVLKSSCNGPKPLAPINIGAYRQANGDVTITATRRDRKLQQCIDLIDAPMSENSLSFDLDIYGPSDTIVRTVTATSLPYTYTSANMTTDFGYTPASNFLVDVYQRSANVGRGQKGSARVLLPAVLGPRDYTDGIIPSDQVMSSSNGTQSVYSWQSNNRLKFDLVSGTAPRLKFPKFGPFQNGRITLDILLSPQIPGGSCGVMWRTNGGLTEGNYPAWWIDTSGGNMTLSWGPDGAGSPTTVGTYNLGLAQYTLQILFIGTSIQVYGCAIGGTLARVMNFTNTNKNQTGYVALYCGGTGAGGYALFDNIKIESFD